MELLLDGTDLDSALRSLAAAPQIDPADLDAAIVSYEDDFAASVEESPAWSIPRQIFARLGADVDALSFDTARYFHGTRVRDPADFLARGILPLGPMAGQLWSMLYELVSDERTESEWNEFRVWVEEGGGGHAGHLHRLKVCGRIHHGPRSTSFEMVRLGRTPTGALPSTGARRTRANRVRRGLRARARSAAPLPPHPADHGAELSLRSVRRPT